MPSMECLPCSRCLILHTRVAIRNGVEASSRGTRKRVTRVRTKARYGRAIVIKSGIAIKKSSNPGIMAPVGIASNGFRMKQVWHMKIRAAPLIATPDDANRGLLDFPARHAGKSNCGLFQFPPGRNIR